MLKEFRYPKPAEWTVLLQRPSMEASSLQAQVETVLEDVRLRGDAAVLEYTERFDKVRLDDLKVPGEWFQQAEALVAEPLKQAMDLAMSNIERFHAAQRHQEPPMDLMPGVRCWRKLVPIDRVGLYVPGGSAPLFSTVLMLGIPARLAGCREVILCTPPDQHGRVPSAILYAALRTGITSVYRIGGVQAIAAMGYGTQSIRKVYKIFGPGNQYVTAAKQRLSREGMAIDMPAGPSEVAVLADESANPSFVAADLLSQAEHGPDSQGVLVTTSERLIAEVQGHLKVQISLLSRAAIARQALANSKAILVESLDQGMDLLNEYAAEHLIISCRQPEALAEKVRNAGSVFLGNYSPESAGDYASGTNHTLPTLGHARAYSGVSLDSFVRKITFQNLTREGLDLLGDAVETMAMEEGLDGHRRAVALRRSKS